MTENPSIKFKRFTNLAVAFAFFMTQLAVTFVSTGSVLAAPGGEKGPPANANNQGGSGGSGGGPVDVCPLVAGNQEDERECDVCPLIAGEQSAQSECDACPSTPGNQNTVDECDVCPDMPDVQTSVSDCAGPTDECTNIPSNQSTVPEGMVKNSDGTCEEEAVQQQTSATLNQNNTNHDNQGQGGVQSSGTNHVLSCPAGTTLLAKYEFRGGTYVAESGGANVAVTGDADGGTFTVLHPTNVVTHVIVNGGNDSKTDTYSPGVRSGTFSNAGLQNNGGRTPDISNVLFCGGAPEGGRGGEQVVVQNGGLGGGNPVTTTAVIAPTAPVFGGLGAAELVDTGESPVSNLMLSMFIIAMTLTLAGATVRNTQQT